MTKKGILRGMLAAVAAIVVMPVAAITLTTFEDWGVQTFYHAKTSVTGTFQMTGVPLRIHLKAEGGSADFTVGVSSGQAAEYAVQTSSTIYLLQGSSHAFVSEYRGLAVNPIITISRIDTPGTTVYMTIDYMKPRRGPGASGF